MAVGGIEMDPKWQNIEEELIVCPICGLIFTDPITIPLCAHTFCKDCLEASVEPQEQTIFTCPKCPAVLPRNIQIDKYPADFRIKRLIEIFDAEWQKTGGVEPVRGCSKCEEDLPVVSWCVDCQDSLCHGCNEFHGKWKEFKLHNTVTIEEFLNNPKDYKIKQQLR